jgi:hypothetical protein
VSTRMSGTRSDTIMARVEAKECVSSLMESDIVTVGRNVAQGFT